MIKKKKKSPPNIIRVKRGKNVREVINNLVGVRRPLGLIARSERTQILLVSG